MSHKWVRGLCAAIQNILKENSLINCINKRQLSQTTHKGNNLSAGNYDIGLLSKLEKPWFMHHPTKSVHEDSIKREQKPIEKISIIGSNEEGIKVSAYILNANLSKELVIMDPLENQDNSKITDAVKFDSKIGSQTMVKATGDVQETKHSDFVIVTAGTKQGDGVSYLENAQKNADLLKDLLPGVANVNPDAVFIITSNPSNLMTWMVQQTCGISPVRCISAGCHLDTARFRYFIAKRLKISPKDVQGYVIGAQGEHSVPVWSSVNVDGVPLSRLFPDLGKQNDPGEWNIIHKNVIEAAHVDESPNTKNSTSWAMPAAIVDMIRAINDGQRVLTVGTDMLGYCSVNQHVILSLPCKMNLNGITHIANLRLTEFESDLFQRSADVQWGQQCAIKM